MLHQKSILYIRCLKNMRVKGNAFMKLGLPSLELYDFSKRLKKTFHTMKKFVELREELSKEPISILFDWIQFFPWRKNL
jgi:hypothetical protein